MKGQDTPQPNKPSGGRPGQRQQKHEQRKVRRRERLRRILGIIVAIIAVIASIVLIWSISFYQGNLQQIANQNLEKTAAIINGHATATANTLDAQANATASVVNAQASATASVVNAQASATAQVYAATPTPAITGSPTPPADTPPAVSQTPVTLADGLQYIDITEGGGVPAGSGSVLSVTYTGWLQSTGQKFDSTYDDGGQPFSVTLGQGQVIKGWEEGLMGVRSGGTRRLIIPASLAYGSQGASQGKVPIPPNATLVFDVTVLSVQ